MLLYRHFFLLSTLGIILSLPSLTTAAPPIVIASIYSFSGKASVTNAPSIQGVRWAVEALNHRGGINGRQVELLELDNASTPIGSKLAAEKAVAANAVSIIGPAYSSHASAAARVAQKHAIPMITNVATDPEVTRVGDFIFRVCFTDTFQGRILAQFARRELDLDKAVILVNANSDYSLSLSRAFSRYYKEMGGHQPKIFYYKDRQDTFDTLIKEVKQAGPDLIFIPGYLESALIVKELSEAGVEATMLGADGWDIDTFGKRGGNSIQSGFFTTHWVGEVQNLKSREFYRLHAGQQYTSASSVLAYDAVMLVADAIDRAGIAEPRAVRRALADTVRFEGITGRISLDAYGDPIKPAVIMQIVKGRTTYLKQVEPMPE